MSRPPGLRRFEGKVTLATGAGSGIGRAAAEAFAREGARTVVCDIDAGGGEETVRRIREAGGEAVFAAADVACAAAVEATVRSAIDAFGRLDCCFNNAGIQGASSVKLADCSEEDWDRVLATNLKGIWLCMKYEIPELLKQGGGAIVNTSSVAGLRGAAAAGAAYAASKHGVIGLSKSAALEYADAGVRVNVVCPGAIQTPMLQKFIDSDPRRAERVRSSPPIGRIGTSQEVAETVLWLCSDAASFVTGHALVVDGGHLA